MSGRGPLWRSVLWIERFLPTPVTMMPQPEQSPAVRRLAAFVPLIVISTVLVPVSLRNRHELGTMLRQNITFFQQLLLGLLIVSALAVVIAGVVTWRRESRRHA